MAIQDNRPAILVSELFNEFYDILTASEISWNTKAKEIDDYSIPY